MKVFTAALDVSPDEVLHQRPMAIRMTVAADMKIKGRHAALAARVLPVFVANLGLTVSRDVKRLLRQVIRAKVGKLRFTAKTAALTRLLDAALPGDDAAYPAEAATMATTNSPDGRSANSAT